MGATVAPMCISRSRAALLGAATFLPIVASLLGVVVFRHLFHAVQSYDLAGGQSSMSHLTDIILISALATLVLGLFYLWHVMTTPRLEGNARFAWALGLLVGNAMVMPVYWWVHIWRPLSEPPAVVD